MRIYQLGGNHKENMSNLLTLRKKNQSRSKGQALIEMALLLPLLLVLIVGALDDYRAEDQPHLNDEQQHVRAVDKSESGDR